MHFAAEFWLVYLSGFIVTCAVCPFVIILAKKLNLMDVPKDNRRVHTKAVPRIGGTAIFLGVVVGVLMGYKMGIIHDGRIFSILVGGALIYLLGTVDDVINLSPKIKLCGQIVCASIVFSLGVRIELFNKYFTDDRAVIALIICYLTTIIWIVAISNTINLIDGLDGLATGVVAIAALCIAYVAYIHGMYVACFPMLILAGSALGFLPFNFFPAKTFMGDGGSLFLGFMLASFAILGPVKGATVVSVIIPILVLFIPIFDTLFAIIRRIINKKPVMQADKGHIHHRLMASGMGQRRTALTMYGICGIMGTAAVLFSRNLFVETIGLILIAGMYMLILITDPNRGKYLWGELNSKITKKEEKQGKNSEN
ncbi:MAG: MraY family glycosyltransferase [Anaerovoracaceae bacterium]